MKQITEKDFLTDNFIDKKAYLPFDDEPEVIEAVKEQVKDAWREVYAFAHTINRAGRRFTETDIIHQCERLYLSKEAVTKVFEKVFRVNTDEFAIDDKPDIYKVEHFLKRNYDFIRNEVTQRSEYRPAGTEEFVKLNADTLYRKIQHANFKFSRDRLISLLKSDFMPSYNPFVSYFESLPPWDYETDHIGQLANFIQTSDQDFHVSQFRKMLVRSVGCSLYGIENRFVYVFVGKKQETGKSTFIRFLNPFGTKYISEQPIRDNKDTYIAFCENFLYNLEELASLSNVEVNHLKSIISMAMIKERKPYAADAEEQPRRVNFFASTNKDEFLTDSENTRWLCVTVQSIDWSYKSKIDVSKVWAQAFALWHDSEFNAQMTAEEQAVRDQTNKEFEVADVEKILISQCFAVVESGKGDFYTLADIMNTISAKYNGKPLNTKQIGKFMTQLGFASGRKDINKQKTRGYWVENVAGIPSADWLDSDQAPFVTPAPANVQGELFKRKLF